MAVPAQRCARSAPIVLLLAPPLLLWLLPDASLDPGAATWLEQRRTPVAPEQDLYYAIYSFEEPPGRTGSRRAGAWSSKSTTPSTRLSRPSKAAGPPTPARRSAAAGVASPCATSVLFGVGLPDAYLFAIRVHDVDGPITLVNLKRAVTSTVVVSKDLPAFLAASRQRFHDPYTGAAIAGDGAKGGLFFASPDPKSRYNYLRLYPTPAAPPPSGARS